MKLYLALLVSTKGKDPSVEAAKKKAEIEKRLQV